MKKHRRILPYLASASLLLFTSCNRGMGCPTNFSISQFVEALMPVWP